MASGQTTNYGLHKWTAEDRVRREEFNQNSDKIDAALAALAGGAKITTGTYTGTGTYGGENPNALTFEDKPKLIIISSLYGGYYSFFTVLFGEATSALALAYSQSSAQASFELLNLFWEDDRVTWVSGGSAYAQGNSANIPYCYAMIS